MALNFEDPQEATQTRLMLSILAKVLDWNIFEGSPTEFSSIGNWNEISEKIKDLVSRSEEIINQKAPTSTFKNIEVVEKVYLNELSIRSQNISNAKLVIIRTLISQLLLLNIIKQKTMVSELLIQYFEEHISNSNLMTKTSNPVQIKRILHILISKNFLNEDSSQNSSFMQSFNQTFSEIIEIVTKLKSLNFTNKMALQVSNDFPELLESNPFFKNYYDGIPENERLNSKNEIAENKDLKKSDFVFIVFDKVFRLFLDRHAKHKIFSESVDDFNMRRILTGIQGVLSQIEKLNDIVQKK